MLFRSTKKKVCGYGFVTHSNRTLWGGALEAIHVLSPPPEEYFEAEDLGKVFQHITNFAPSANILNDKRNIILIALVVSVALMAAKFVAYFITQSNFVLTDAAESIANVVAGAFAFYSIYLTALPRDINHPYGHGKVEFFSAFIEGTLIGIAGIGIIVKSAYSLFHPSAVHQILTGAIIIGITGGINGVLGYILIGKGKQLRSIALEADGRHLITDMYTSGALIVGLLIIYFTNLLWLDSALSIGVGLYISWNGVKLVRRSVGGLMDEADFDVVNDIITILNDKRKPEWIDIHNLRAQKYGPELHIDCHVTLPCYFDLNRVHEEVSLIDELINTEAQIKTELFIHTDPCLPNCCHYCSMPNCPIRAEEKRITIPWTMVNVTRNKKHFE